MAIFSLKCTLSLSASTLDTFLIALNCIYEGSQLITDQSNSVEQRIPTVRDAYNPPKKRRAGQVRSTYLPPGSLITDRADLAKTKVMQLVDADDILVNDVSPPLKTLIKYRLKGGGNSAVVKMTIITCMGHDCNPFFLVVETRLKTLNVYIISRKT